MNYYRHRRYEEHVTDRYFYSILVIKQLTWNLPKKYGNFLQCVNRQCCIFLFCKLSGLAGWPAAGQPVGKSDFNENPVVSLDLDLDFGLRLRVCQ